MRYIILIIYVLLSASGITCFKLGSEKEFSLAVSAGSLSLKVSWLSVLGLAFYFCSFILYMWLISKYQVSYLIPILSGISYVVTLAAAILFLHERLSLAQLVGSFAILAGIILMNIHTK